MLPRSLALICSSPVSNNYCLGTLPRALCCVWNSARHILDGTVSWLDEYHSSHQVSGRNSELWILVSNKSSAALAWDLPFHQTFLQGSSFARIWKKVNSEKKEKYTHLGPDFKKLLSIGLQFSGGFKSIFNVVLHKIHLISKTCSWNRYGSISTALIALHNCKEKKGGGAGRGSSGTWNFIVKI